MRNARKSAGSHRCTSLCPIPAALGIVYNRCTMLENFDAYVGSAAGIATAMLWTLTVIFFTAASRRIGPTFVNTARLALAIALHGVTFRLLSGQWVPDTAAGQILYLAASGIIGLSVGDQALLTAFVDVGPRITSLIMATTPIFAVFFGWVVLGETLGRAAWAGIAMVIGGVAWVVLERPEPESLAHRPRPVRGVLLALVYAACQAGGLLLSKQGIGHGWLPESEHISPQSATLIRMVFAGLGMLPIIALNQIRVSKRRAAGLSAGRIGTPRAGLLFAAAGAIVGPFLGVWMSLVASDRAPLGVAQTLCSMVPIFILPFAALVYKERITARAALGAFVAVAGSALLFLKV
jgi:drug/metabolite transporter (DMT)-like permease